MFIIGCSRPAGGLLVGKATWPTLIIQAATAAARDGPTFPYSPFTLLKLIFPDHLKYFSLKLKNSKHIMQISLSDEKIA